jgi:hypothetical protein
MNQFEFSELAEAYFAQNHPFLLHDIKSFEDGSFESTCETPNEKLTLWLSTANREITIGFEDTEGKSDFHTHMSLFGAIEPYEQLHALSELLNSILNNIEVIVHSSISGFSLTVDFERDLRDKLSEETLVVYKWDEL